MTPMRTPALVRIAPPALLVLAWAAGAFAQEPSSARTPPVNGLALERVENRVVIVSGSEERVRFGARDIDCAERATPVRGIDAAGTLRARRYLGEPFARFGSSVRGPDLTLDRGSSDSRAGAGRERDAPSAVPTRRGQASVPAR